LDPGIAAVTTTANNDAQLIFSILFEEAREHVDRGNIREWLKTHFCTGEPTWISSIAADFGFPASAITDLMALVTTLDLCLAEPTEGKWRPSLKELRKLGEDFRKIDALLRQIGRTGIGVTVSDPVEDDDGIITFGVDNRIRRIRGELLHVAKELEEISVRTGRPPEYPQCAQRELERVIERHHLELSNPEKIALSQCLFDDVMIRYEKFARGGFGDAPRLRDAIRYAAEAKNSSVRKTRAKR
jgi:hypothetical protein